MEKITKGFIYNMLYHVFSLLTPLIVTPYITRVLSEDLLGTNALINAEVSYFCMFGTLGMTYLGVRRIASIDWHRNKEKLNDEFWKLFYLQFSLYIAVIVLYLFRCMVKNGYERILYFTYFIYIISMLFDINWFFQGVEEFKFISIRNICIIIFSTVLIFVCIRDSNDIKIYIICLYFPQLIMNIFMFISAKRKFALEHVKYRFDVKLFKSSMLLAIPTIAVSVYTILDKVILGIYRTKAEVAIYDQGQVLVRVILSVISAWGTVVLPRMSNVLKNSKSDMDANNLLVKSSKTVFFLSNGLFWGLLAVNESFIKWYLPKSYYGVIDVLYICAPMILIVSLENIFGVQILLARGLDKQYTISLVLAAIINCVSDFVFIPYGGIRAACICSVVAEVFALVVQILFCSKKIKVKEILTKMIPFFVSGIFMFGMIKYCLSQYENKIQWIIFSCLIGALAYVFLTAKKLAKK